MNKRISYNLIGQIISFMCSLGIGFLVTPYVVKQLGAETYGFVGLANNFTSYITLFTVAIDGMLSRYVTVEYARKDYKQASGYFSTAFFTQLILALILIIPMLLFAGNIEVFINISPEITSDVKILWTLVFISFLSGLSFSSFGTVAFVKNRLEIQAIISIVSNLIRAVVLLIAFLFFTPYVWYIGLATILANFITIIGNFYCKKKMMPEVEISLEHFNKKYIYNLVVVGVWNSLNRLQQILYSGLDLLLTNLFINGTEMGLLSVAKTIPTHISSLISTVSGAFDPGMTIAYGKGDKEDFLNQTKFAMKMSGFICSVPILGFTCFGINFYSLWMPTLSGDEIVKIQILAMLTLLPQVFSVYIFPLYTVNTITCKLKIPVLVSLGIGLANVSIVFLLLRFTSLGVYAVAGVSSILWLFRIFLFVPLYAAWNVDVKRLTFYKPLLRGVINVIVVGSALFACSKLFYGQTWIQFIIICIMCGALGYVLSFMVMFDRGEKVKSLNLIKRKIIKG